MSDERRPDAGVSAVELRDAFDAAFARPIEASGRETVALLALRAGGEGVAVRVLEIAGIMAARPIVPVPSPRPEFLGISGIRGAVVPIYSLARLLGRGDDGAPRWIVLAADGSERVGLAVAGFERHLVVPAIELRPAAHPAGAGHAPEMVHVPSPAPLHGAMEIRGRAGGDPWPVLSVPSLVRAITRR